MYIVNNKQTAAVVVVGFGRSLAMLKSNARTNESLSSTLSLTGPGNLTGTINNTPPNLKEQLIQNRCTFEQYIFFLARIKNGIFKM